MLATQNPIEHEGTYPLPEAQVDRFMFKLVVTYPERREEREVLDRMTADRGAHRHGASSSPSGFSGRRKLVQGIYADDRIKEYVLDLVAATRRPAEAGLGDLAPLIEFGASPRAAIYLLRAAKAHAFLQGRPYVTPDDIKALGLDVLRHRVILTYRADAEGMGPDAVVRRILEAVRCHESGGGHARGAAARDHHPPSRARHHGRRVLECVPGPGRGVRRGA